MTTERYTYFGRDRRGVGRCADVTLADLPAWVERQYRNGWETLTVQHVPTRLDAAGRRIAVRGVEWPVVAKIDRNVDGVRAWWSE